MLSALAWPLSAATSATAIAFASLAGSWTSSAARRWPMLRWTARSARSSTCRTMTWALYATALIVAGIRKRYAPIRYMAIAIVAARDAPRHRHARQRSTRVVCPLARRPAARLRRLRRRRAPPVGAGAGHDDGAAAGGHRGRAVSLLGARQPRRGLSLPTASSSASTSSPGAAARRRHSPRHPSPAAGPGMPTASSSSRRAPQVPCSACRPRVGRRSR